MITTTTRTTNSVLLVGISVFLVIGFSNAFTPITTSTTSRTNLEDLLSRNIYAQRQFTYQELQSTSSSTALYARFPWRRPLSSSNEEEEPNGNDNNSEEEEILSRRRRLRKKVKGIARKMMTPMPKAIASLLSDATFNAVDLAVEEVATRKHELTTSFTPSTTIVPTTQLEFAKNAILSDLTLDLVNDAFEPMEQSLQEMETSLEHARDALTMAKSQASQAIEAIQAAAIAEAMGAASVVEEAQEQAERKMIETIYTSSEESDLDVLNDLTLEDLEFCSGMEMPFLDQNSCLVPGEPIVRVEKAPENSRRIFAGIDIMASVDDVWNILTEYDNLQNVVPNLVVNEVMDTFDGKADQSQVTIDTSQSGPQQCKQMAQQMKGSLLKQVGGAKVVGINFSARTTLDVREWPQGLPDFAHFNDEMWDGKSRDVRAQEYVKTKLERYRFPRPFAISDLPTKDISMQSIPDDDGEFRMYQGVWRMQPLPGCASPGKNAMRLTYAVEISPRAYLPVQLVEGRIVKDLCANLLAIRDCVGEKLATPA